MDTKNKLSNWLNKNRITSKPSAAKPAPTAQTAKPAASSVKPAQAPRPSAPAAQTAAKPQGTQPSRGNKPPQKNNNNQGGGRGKQGGGRPRGRMLPGGKKSNHDPLADKPTHDRKDETHVTNRLKQNVGDIRVVPLGGMEQVGANMMFIEWGDDIIILDTGFLFPDPEHLGIDVLVPDVRYLVKNKHKIRGIVYTHGHLDHIGGVPYMLRELGFPPMYASRLTKEIILANSDEFGINNKLKITECTPKSKIKLGRFEVEFFHVNHSIPDSLGIVVNTPYGSIVHTSDFKIDHNPSDDQPSDLIRIAQIGHRGVILGMVDSTNAMKDGHTMSEHIVEDRIEKVIMETKGRLILTTFASSVGRVARAIEAGERAGRTVFLSGRSMEKNVIIAKKLNYLRCKDKTVQIMSRAANKLDPSKVLILCTGSQGEELAALTRMADGRHKDVKLKKEDTIVFSSSPIPGNEMAIVKVKNNLAEIGLTTINHTDADVYVSGHGYKQEIKTVTALLNPKYLAPIHGELYMRHGARDMLVAELGIKKERTHIMKNGQGVVINGQGVRMMTEKEVVPSTMHMYELGYKVPQTILQERQDMADSGMTVLVIAHTKGSVKKVEIISKGYKTIKHGGKLWENLESTAKKIMADQYAPDRPVVAIQDLISKKCSDVLYQRGKATPMVHTILVG